MINSSSYSPKQHTNDFLRMKNIGFQSKFSL